MGVAASLSQTVTTVPGTRYFVSFNYNSPGNANELTVEFGGAQILNRTNADVPNYVVSRTEMMCDSDGIASSWNH